MNKKTNAQKFPNDKLNKHLKQLDEQFKFLTDCICDNEGQITEATRNCILTFNYSLGFVMGICDGMNALFNQVSKK